MLSIATENIDDVFDFITPAIVSGCKFDLHRYISAAIELSKHKDRKICARAVHALGRVTYGESISLANNALQAIESATTYLEPEVCYTAIRSSYALGKVDGIEKDDVERIIQNILTIEHENILHAASLILMFEKDTISNSTAEILLRSLSKTQLEHSATIQNIDLGMDGLLERGMVECVIEFLEMFLQRHSNVQSPIKAFDNVVRNFLKNKATILKKIVTRWLLSKKTVLGRSASDFFKMYTDDGITLFVDNSQLNDLSQNELAVLAKKACGWLFLSPVTATSFIISIAEYTEDEDIAAFISDLIYDPLAIAYAGSVKKYLLEVSSTASSKVKEIAITVLARLERYHAGLEAAYSIKELQPPLEHRQAYHRHFARLMADARKQASKQSFLTQIFGRSSTLLYGTSSVHSVHDVNGNATRKEIPMNAIKTSVEL